MAFKIERALTGLFGAFRLQSQGNLPYLVAEGVQPALDLNMWALQAIQLEVTPVPQAGSTTVAALGIVGAAFTQPEDWLVTAVNTIGTAGGPGDFVGLQLVWAPRAAGVQSNLCGNQRYQSLTTQVSLNAGTVFAATQNNMGHGPFFSPAGSVWSLYCHELQNVSGAITGYATVTAYHLQSG